MPWPWGWSSYSSPPDHKKAPGRNSGPRRLDQKTNCYILMNSSTEHAPQAQANQAIAYVEALRLSCNSWQVYEFWQEPEAHMAVLAQWDSGFEVQNLIRVPTAGGPVSWIPLRIFRGDRASDYRGGCVWFNPEEVCSDEMEHHNRQVLAAAMEQPTSQPHDNDRAPFSNWLEQNGFKVDGKIVTPRDEAQAA